MKAGAKLIFFLHSTTAFHLKEYGEAERKIFATTQLQTKTRVSHGARANLNLFAAFSDQYFEIFIKKWQ